MKRKERNFRVVSAHPLILEVPLLSEVLDSNRAALEGVFEEEEVIHPEGRARFPMVEVDMLLEEDLEVTLSYATIAIGQDMWLKIVSNGRATSENPHQWPRAVWARMPNNLVTVEEEEEVVEEVEALRHRLQDLITKYNLKLGCMR